MIEKLSIMAIVAIVAVTAGLVGYTSATLTEVSPATSFAASPLVSGHVTLEARDSDGNLKAYRLSDNAITRNGEDCVAKALFTANRFNSGTATSGFCLGAITKPFVFVALGTGTTQEQGTDNAMQAQTAQAGLDLPTVGGGSITTWTNSTGGAGGGSAQIVITKAFTNTGGTIAISEAGLFNDTAASTNGMFAHKVFAPISLATNDQLTVTWTINLGNTTSIN